MTQHKTQQSGFTLIEVLLAVGITSMVMLTVGVTFRVTLLLSPPQLTRNIPITYIF